MNALVINIGGTNVKILATGQQEPVKFPSGPAMTATAMVAGSQEAHAGLDLPHCKISPATTPRNPAVPFAEESKMPNVCYSNEHLCAELLGITHKRIS